MFGIGETELVIIVVFAFLLFGPDKLPGMGRTLGRVLRQFREASDGFTEVVQTNIVDPASEELEKSPKQRQREAEAQLDEDADSPAAQDEAPKRRETFAERKARLQAEREAAERKAEPVAHDEVEQQGPALNADSDDDVDRADEPSQPSAADLYAMSGRKSSRAQERETPGLEPEPAQDLQRTNGEEDGSDEA